MNRWPACILFVLSLLVLPAGAACQGNKNTALKQPTTPTSEATVHPLELTAVPLADPQQLIAPGADLAVQSLQMEMIPGEASILAVVSSAQPSRTGCQPALGDQTQYLELFRFNDATKKWDRIMDGSQWPTSASGEVISPKPSADVCLPVSDLEIRAVRMRSDRDFLVVNDTVWQGTGNVNSRLFILGFSGDELTLLYQSEDYPKTILPSLLVLGDQVVYRPNLLLASDPGSFPTLREESVLRYDSGTDKVVATSRLHCMDGTISSMGGPPLNIIEQPIQGGEATSTFVLDCGATYGITPSTVIQGASQLSVGQRVSVRVYRLSSVRELVADEVDVLP